MLECGWKERGMVKKDRLAKVCGGGFRRAVVQRANVRAATIYIGLLVNYCEVHNLWVYFFIVHILI